MLAELEQLDESRAWPRLFQKLNWEASQRAGALTVARLPENRQLNRYRDVLPYDHSRIILKQGSSDYINANLVEISRLNKKYILTQGPLPHTANHFWQMIWEQNTAAIIMLNKVVEKNQIKCYQYWPCGETYAHSNQLEFGNFKINYLRELHNEYFTIRSLELENILTGEKRPIEHFHYLTWPDFGVPTSPATFLAFLFEVRRAGVMSNDVGPCVIHCSAGIGRSGTFVMVDSVLTEIEHEEDMNQIDIQAMLLEIRQYRVGLIQTPDQLRFTYLAILEGVRVLMPEIYHRDVKHQIQPNTGDDQDDEVVTSKRDDTSHQEGEKEETPPPLPPRRRHAETTDEPENKKSRIGEPVTYVTEPKSEVEEVFSDSGSDGSDEVINLSSLSESETDDDTVQIRESLLDDSKDDETQQNYDLKEQNKLSPVHAELLIKDDTLEQTEEEGLQITDEGSKLKDVPQSTAVEDQHTKEGTVHTKDKEDPQPLDEGVLHLSDEGSCNAKDYCLNPRDGCKPSNQGCEVTTGGLKTLDEGLQSTSKGQVKENESGMEVRKRREERRKKTSDMIDKIKKNVKQSEDTKVWNFRLMLSGGILLGCTVAYLAYRYFTHG